MNNKRFLCLVLVLTGLIISDYLSAQTLSEQLIDAADIIVAAEGTGDYLTVQQGINAIPDNNTDWKVILVKKGNYHEKVVLNYKKTKVVIVGEDVDSTIITHDDYGDAVLPGHTFSTYTFRADANDFQAYNITFNNPTTLGQGVAYHSNGDRQILYHCRITGNQDTYFDNFRTRRYIKDCFIEGGVDFIFGFGVTLFDSCQIHANSTNAFLTAASTPPHYEFGYVFKNCRLTSDPDVKNVSLGRPWFDYANVIYFNCWEPESIKEEGWSGWSGREETCIFREYNCFGPGSDTVNRIYFGEQLDPALAPRYITDTIFAVSNFPTHLGYEGDTAELMYLYRRFEESGYAGRADTILYAGRDHYPEYPTENWSPEFFDGVYSIIKEETFRFMDSVNGEINIENLLWDNKPLEGFDPEVQDYVIEISSEDTASPVFLVTGEGVFTTVEYPEILPGFAYVSAHSIDRVNSTTYNVYVSQDSAYWNSTPSIVIINYVDTIFFEEGVYQYYTNLTEDETSVRTVVVRKKYDGQIYDYKKPTSIPGDLEVTIVAPNKQDTSKYYITVSEQSAIKEISGYGADIQVINPVRNKLILYNRITELYDINIAIYDLGGRLVYNKSVEELPFGKTEIKLEAEGILPGIYVYRISLQNKIASGKLLKIQ